MPQISRIRIVNFQYNNGKRLIPDELYDLSVLSDDQRNACANTLIALINGGGKTVLVHLMLQPVLPGAKVSKRRIEDYFSSASCHCYVLLEWRKDNSPEKLLTGISMASSVSTADKAADTAEKRGRSIRYYTFYANYAEDSAACSIANLPLSWNENGLFVAAEYEYVRKLQNKSGMRDLKCFSSEHDDKKDWKRILAGYGIYQDEWRRIMEPLNSDEGGMSQFFTQSRFQTADRLINGLFIPAVETRLGQSDQSSDSSLATMLLNYVKRYEQQAENIRNRERCLAFREDISSLQKNVQDVWTLWDSRNGVLRTMFGYSAALEMAVSALGVETEKLERELDSTAAAIRHLDWEDASERWYQCEDADKRSMAALEEASQHLEELEASQEADGRRRKILTAARYAERCRELQGRLDGTLKSIADKTRGDDTAARLGGSLRTVVEAALPGQRNACQTAEAANCAAQQALADADTAMKAAEDAERTCFGKQTEADADWKGICGRTDRLVNTLNIDAMRNLSGLYMTEELEEARKEHQTRLDAVREELERTAQEKAETETALRQIPEDRASLRVQLQDTESAAKKNQSEMDAYRVIEDGVREICRLYSLDFAARFSGSVREYLNRMRSDQNRKIRDIERETELTKDELSAAESGAVHVPRKVLDCLDDAGIPYQTCEQYLLAQIRNGNLSAADCVEILESCPSAAFGILTEELALLGEIQRPQWLPASVPVFTNEEMEAVLARKAVRPGAFSRYSVQSFMDRANYVEGLRNRVETLRERGNQRRDALENTEAQLKTAEAFQDYDADWLRRREEQAEKLRSTCEDCQKRIEALNEDETEKQKRLDQLEQFRQEREDERKKLENWLERFAELREELEREQAAYHARSEADRRHRESVDKLDYAKKERTRAEQEANKQEAARNAEQETLKKMEDAAQAVAEYDVQEAEAGDWLDLFQQYRTLLDNREASIRQLQAEADSLRGDMEAAEKKLSRLGLEEREYQGVPCSPDEEDTLSRQIESREEALKEARTAFNDRTREASAAKTELKHAQEQLKQYGGQPLEPDRIGGNRERRRKECQDRSDALQNSKEKLSKRVREYDRQIMKVNAVLENLSNKADKPGDTAPVPLLDDYKGQWTDLHEQWKRLTGDLEDRRNKLDSVLKDLTAKFTDSVQGDFLKQAADLLKNSPPGDVYFTLDQRIDANVHAMELEIAKLETDLKAFHDMKRELVHQCCVQGEQIYHGLKDMMNSARVRLGKTGRLTEMIRFGLPDKTDPKRAEEEIAAELEDGTKKLLELMGDKSVSETDVRTLSERIVSSGVLLRKYVQLDQITLEAYKVDAVEGRGEYRSWKQTLVNNSGAEKFLVYFSMILTLMNYTRGGDTSGTGQTGGVLILDNPFGVITSPHVLDPMFRIAKKFCVQLICLSDITKCDITSCFDTVIHAVVRENPLSSVSLLTHEGNERIEHGFYRSVQLSL